MQLYCYRLFMKCLFCFFNEIFNVKVSFFCLLAATFFFGAHRGSRENIPKVTFCKFSRVSHRVSPPPSLATAQNYSHTRRQWHVKLLFFLLHGKQFYPRIKSTHKKKVFSASWEGKKINYIPLLLHFIRSRISLAFEIKARKLISTEILNFCAEMRWKEK